MRRFRFRPERLLHLEMQREQQARLELARLTGELRELELREERLERSRADCLQADAPVGLGTALAAGLGRVAAEVHARREQADRRQREAVAQWRRRRTAVEVLAALRARQHGAWQHDALREEIRELDECARLGARRRAP